MRLVKREVVAIAAALGCAVLASDEEVELVGPGFRVAANSWGEMLSLLNRNVRVELGE